MKRKKVCIAEANKKMSRLKTWNERSERGVNKQNGERVKERLRGRKGMYIERARENKKHKEREK